MDFSGTMDAVIGTGQIFGIEMPENFKRPFFQGQFQSFGNVGILHWARGLKTIYFIL